VNSARRRCGWAESDPLLIAYHDAEWGVPSFDDRHLFELLSLEGAQAGLSWTTILRKREGYRKAFAGFDPAAVARFRPERIARLLRNPDVVRHRGKLESVPANARALVGLRRGGRSFHEELWNLAGGRPRMNAWKASSQVPAETAESREMSRALRRLGFRFVGPTICYSFMQAVGMVNDHVVGCFRYRQVGRGSTTSPRAS
jgi:DNA-3-methyladenine glycosylase I